MDNQVEEIKQKLNIVDVIGKYLPLKKRGRHFIACCPFHNEKTPSFTVSPELQIFKCFGCGKAGDVFTFLQEREHIDFKDALEELAKMAGITLIKNPQSEAVESKEKRLITLNEEVIKFYQYILLTHPLGKTALQYVLYRGITLSTLRLFRLGFSPQNPAIIVNYLFKKGFTSAELIASGTFGVSAYGSKSLYDRFTGRLIFPLSDYRNRVLGFSGRILPSSPNPNLAKYINTPETEIYHKSHLLFGLNLAKESIRDTQSVIITEGEFDMISPYQAGITNIVAIKGTAFTVEQLQLLKRYTDTLILALDSDFAGNAAAHRSIELADSMGFDINVLVLENYKDPDEAVRTDLAYFKSRLANTLPVWDFIINTTVATYGIDSIKSKKQILSIVLPFLVKITNSVIRGDYYRTLSNLIGSDIDSVHEEAQKYIHPPALSIKPITTSPVITDTYLARLEKQFLTYIFGAKKPVSLAARLSKHLQSLTDHRSMLIAKLLLSVPDFQPADFQQQLEEEIRPYFQEIYLEATNSDIDSQSRLREIKKIASQIGIYNLKNKIKELSQKIAQQETSYSQDDSLSGLETEYNQLLQQLARLQTKKV